MSTKLNNEESLMSKDKRTLMISESCRESKKPTKLDKAHNPSVMTSYVRYSPVISHHIL